MADYKIAVEIALIGSIRHGLEALSSQLLGINSKVKDIEGGFKRWGVVFDGLAVVGLVKGMEHMVSAGGELVKQQTLLRNMGVSQADVLETTAKAQLATHAIIGTTIAENVKGMREMMGIMPSLGEAQDRYVSAMRGAKVLEALTGTPASDSLQTLVKAVELRGGATDPVTGKIDPERFEREMQAAVKAIIASGGLVNAASLLQMMKTAGPAARMMSDADQFYKNSITRDHGHGRLPRRHGDDGVLSPIPRRQDGEAIGRRDAEYRYLESRRMARVRNRRRHE